MIRLDAQHKACIRRTEQTDRPGAAIEIQQRLLAAETGIPLHLLIHPLRQTAHLIEASRADLEHQIAQPIVHYTLAGKASHRSAIIQIDTHQRITGRIDRLCQHADQLLCARDPLAVNSEGYHAFAGSLRCAHRHRLHQSLIPSRIVGCHMVFFHKAAQRLRCSLRRRKLKHAGSAVKHPVAAPCHEADTERPERFDDAALALSISAGADMVNCFVPGALVRSGIMDDLPDIGVGNAPEAYELVSELPFFERPLCRRCKRLVVTAATDRYIRAGRLDTVLAGFFNANGTADNVTLLHACNLNCSHIAGHGACGKDRQTIGMADALPLVTHIRDPKCKDVTLLDHYFSSSLRMA